MVLGDTAQLPACLAYLLARVQGDDLAGLTDPRCYNIRWLELLHEVKPVLDAFAEVL